MRTVYLGTSAFAATVLEHLAHSPHRPALVITRPDARRGRGRRLTPPPVVETAQTLGLDLAQPEDVNSPEARDRIAAAEPEVVTICAFGALIREPLLSAHEILNVHPSCLPRWRGAAPIERAIEAGDEVTGVCIMRPVAAMDAGPVCLAGREPIRPDDDFGSLSARLAALGGALLVQALDERPGCSEQSEEGVTIASKIDAGDRRLDPRQESAMALERRVRALRPHIGTWVELRADRDGRESGERLGVLDARAASPVAGSPHPAPGALAAVDGRLLLGCTAGALELLEVQPAGRRAMGAADWLRGGGVAFVAPAAADVPGT